jgi:hypothetical protein
MAGLFAHFVIVDLAAFSKRLNSHGLKKLKVLLLRNPKYVLLGANSPDLPYSLKDMFGLQIKVLKKVAGGI